MSHPAANANEAFNDAKKKEEKEEIDRIINRGTNPLLVKDDWTVDQLISQLIDRSITPDEVYEYYLVHDREPDQEIIALINAIEHMYPVLVYEESEKPDYDVSIYKSTLWSAKKRKKKK
jgi:hypothetical protein